jgi:hypothetical protein
MSTLFLHSRDVKLHNHFMNFTKERTDLFTISTKELIRVITTKLSRRYTLQE